MIYTSDYVGKWYWLKYDDKILLVENMSSELERATSAQKLIQGDSGTHVISFNGKTWNTTMSSLALIEVTTPKQTINEPKVVKVAAPFSSYYIDAFDLLINDFDQVRRFLFNGGASLLPKHLLTSASINIENDVRLQLSYNSSYDQKFQEIRYINADPPATLDFLARAAKNYDCRFNVTANDAALSYKILSGSINITVSHTKSFLINLESEYPIYSPQGYQISGSFKIPANNWDELLSVFENNDVTLSNFSLLVGSRYLRLGQASVQSSIKFNNESFRTAEINFVGYARI
jgi:hypothetical protein